MKVLTTPNAVLRMIASQVSNINEDVRLLVKNMLETMSVEQGIGLAAPQVGVSLRVIVTSVGGDTVLINPKILEFSSDTSGFREGCLSIPGKRVMVQRPTRVKVEYQDLDGNLHQDTFDGLRARVVQHEIDHLDGILMVDRISK